MKHYALKINKCKNKYTKVRYYDFFFRSGGKFCYLPWTEELFEWWEDPSLEDEFLLLLLLDLLWSLTLVTKILESLFGDWNSFCLLFLLSLSWWWLDGTSNVLIVILVGLSDWLTWWIIFWVLAFGEPFVLSGEFNKSSCRELSNPKQV